MTATGLKDLYRSMVLIREAEETVLRLFSQNRMPGFIHSYIGEEATAVGVCAPLRPDDYVTSPPLATMWPWPRCVEVT